MTKLSDASNGVASFLRRAEAAAYVQHEHGVPCAPRTLAKLATLGGGPQIHYFGKTPLYRPSDLDAWVAGRISGPVASTAERETINQ